MKTTMQRLLLAVLLCAASASEAGLTSIAQLPLLKVAGTGAVKPNIMLMYDNSGSMTWAHTPDYVDDATTCRYLAYMVDDPTVPMSPTSNVERTTNCRPGRAPFNSADFNRQYYNPAVSYQPPVDSAGKPYPSQDAAKTSSWTYVTTDGFSVNMTDLNGTKSGATNLVSDFPDLEFCSRSDCRRNTATYTYPSNYYYKARAIKGNPYYYTIKTAEYCSDDKLTDCVGTAVNAPAPAGYPYPAKVRWCSSPTLATGLCRAKYDVATYKYPRFSNPGGGVIAAYGTITVGATGDANSVRVDAVSIMEGTTKVQITQAAVAARYGTNSTAKQAALASALAAAIVSKSGLANQYTACVRTPADAGVLPCSQYDIHLATDNVVAVIPLDCASDATSKSSDCSMLADDTRSGWAITASGSAAGVLATAPLASGDAVFVRTDIVASRNSYPRAPARKDCAGTSCTYAEEMTNFANWYAYYKTRNQSMKSAVGRAFKPVTESFRVGLATLSVAASKGAMTQLPAEFTGAKREAWYTALYAMDGNGGTPTRKAMHSIGEMFANQGNYAFKGDERVVQYPCQQNYMIITTDGYWNGGTVPGINSNDEVENQARFCSKSSGCVDARGQDTTSLADIALYWYNGGSDAGTVSLRPDLEPDISTPGSVPSPAGGNTHLHVNTYTLGLGVDGMMTYEKDYDKAPKAGGDFANLLNSVQTGCPWNGDRQYVWPDPEVSAADKPTVQARVDDLWHAAVNGHGKYFAASDPDEVIDGLSSALNKMEEVSGASSAAATSTPNVSQVDNMIFADTFTTVHWWGELAAKAIDVATGEVSKKPVWTSTDSLGTMVAAASDTRKIYMAGAKGQGARRNFQFDEMGDEQAWFKDQCSQLSQCEKLGDNDKLIVNSGSNIVGWLRGQQQYADDRLLRAYAKTTTPPYATANVPIVLGDIVSSRPAFVRDPRKYYDLPDYADFKKDKYKRSPTVYTAANDGMLHAFHAGVKEDGELKHGGEERWAYVPLITMKKLTRQAGTDYATHHQFTADGSPDVADVYFKSDKKWHTVLVAGLGGGGRGYYALDVTDPEDPVPLWELCADPAVCTRNDPNIGLTFGNAQFGTYKGEWVVFLTSGYNNVPGTDGVATGDGGAYLYIVDVATGVVRERVQAGTASTVTPPGLAKITAVSPNSFTDPAMTQVYGGDNQGRMWRFDLTGTAPAVTLMGNAGALQPITTRPDVSECVYDELDSKGDVVGTKRKTMVVYGTGRMLNLDDIPVTDVQSLYVLADTTSTVTLRGPAMVKQALAKAGGKYTISGADVDLNKDAGWYVDFDKNERERVTIDPKIVSGTVVAVTNVPEPSTACKVGGTANIYQLGVCNGKSPRLDGLAGQLLLNDASAVGFIIVNTGNGDVAITTSAKGDQKPFKLFKSGENISRKSGWRRVHD